MLWGISSVTTCETSFSFPLWVAESDGSKLLSVVGWSDSPGTILGLAGRLRFASLRLLDAASDGSSLVLYAEQVPFLKARNDIPRDRVTLSRIERVLSVWSRSLANPCQWAKRYSISINRLLWGSGRRPSKTGIAHCWQGCLKKNGYCFQNTTSPAGCLPNLVQLISSYRKCCERTSW